MMKFAAAAVICSAGLFVCTETAQAKCRKNKCCSPAPTCCAPAPTCAAPASTCAPAAAPAAPYETPAPPTPPAASSAPEGDAPAKISQNDAGRQTFRNFSYDTNETAPPAVGTAPASVVNPPASQKKSPGSNMFRADRKMRGIRTY